MGDVMYLAVFLACWGATAALVVLCERLMPRAEGGQGHVEKPGVQGGVGAGGGVGVKP